MDDFITFAETEIDEDPLSLISISDDVSPSAEMTVDAIVIDDSILDDNASSNEPVSDLPAIVMGNDVSGNDSGNLEVQSTTNESGNEAVTLDAIYNLLDKRLPAAELESESELKSEFESESESESESELTLLDVTNKLDELYNLESEQFEILEKNQVMSAENNNNIGIFGVSVTAAIFGSIIAALLFKRF